MSVAHQTQIAGGTLLGTIAIIVICYILARYLGKRRGQRIVWWPMAIAAVVVAFQFLGQMKNG